MLPKSLHIQESSGCEQRGPRCNVYYQVLLEEKERDNKIIEAIRKFGYTHQQTGAHLNLHLLADERKRREHHFFMNG
jgi:hypothetical protein